MTRDTLEHCYNYEPEFTVLHQTLFVLNREFYFLFSVKM